MTLNLAEQLIRRLATDPAFRHVLASLDPAGKRAFLDANGFRGVTAEWLQSVALDAFKDLTVGNDKVADEDAMAAVTAATTAAAIAPAAASMVLILVNCASAPTPGPQPAASPSLVLPSSGGQAPAASGAAEPPKPDKNSTP